jgi:hypothetical protein
VKRFSITAVLATFAFFASAAVPQAAKILAIKKHSEGRIVSWSNRSPIFDGYPFYDLTLAWNGKKYVVRYESMTGYFPGAWQIGHEVTLKRERGLFTLYNGQEPVPAREVNSHDCVEVSAPPAGFSPMPQVPCD